MANTHAYKAKIEKWFRDEYLPPKHPGCDIDSEPVQLSWGGKFAYDARVRKKGKLQAVYCLSCSEYETAGSKGGAGKFNKIQGDILKMLGTKKGPKKVLVFTGRTMLKKVQDEQERGRLPPEIHCELATLPKTLAALVRRIKTASEKEVTPKRTQVTPL